MNTSKITAQLISQMDWSQSDLVPKSGISRVMIGNYERDEAVSFIKTAMKIAQAFHISRDYLAGEGISASFDKKTVERMHEIESLNPTTKEKLFFFIKNVFRYTKTQKTHAQ